MVTLKRAFERDFAWEPGKYILLWTREDKLRQLLRTNTNGGTQSETATEQSAGDDNRVGDRHPAWDILIPRLNYREQLKISQQSRRLSNIVKNNAESKLRKYRRETEDKHISRKQTNPRKWAFYRYLTWIFQDQDEIQTRYGKRTHSPYIEGGASAIAVLAKAETRELWIIRFDLYYTNVFGVQDNWEDA